MSKILRQNKPAKQRKAVVFCADRNVVRFAQFVADQIMKAEPLRDYDICICTFDADILTLTKVDPEIRICQIDETLFAELTSDQRVTNTAYILLGLPVIFANEYDQVVYLDADVFLKSGTISELFESASPDYAVSGVLDVCQWKDMSPGRWLPYFDAIDIIGKKYLNTGVLVLDIAKCIECQFTEKTILAAKKRGALVAKYPDVYFFHDQTAINTVLRGNWAELPLGWNWQMRYFASRLTNEFEPNIVHFIGKSKPWALKPVGFTKQYLPEYVAYFRDTLNENLYESGFQGRVPKSTGTIFRKIKKTLTKQNIISWANQLNPIYHTKIREIGAVMQARRRIKKIERTMKQRQLADNDTAPFSNLLGPKK